MFSISHIQQQFDVNDEQVEAVHFLANLEDNNKPVDNATQATSIVTTHCAHIILTKNRAYKIKRAIKYSYLDMLDLSSREALCKRELEINKPSLPNIYLKVVPLTKNDNGNLSMNGPGAPVEWVLVMERFSEQRVLDTMAQNGTLSNEIAKQVGESIARYHAALPSVTTKDGYQRMNEIVLELIEELGHSALGFDKQLIHQFTVQSKAIVAAQETLLDSRATSGYIKRCHGDLHLRNIVLMGDGPYPFDALEFDERMATIDVLYDLAFVLMDLSHRNLVEQQNTLLNRYISHCEPEDLAGLALMPLFLMCRAGIRAMTTAQNPHNQSEPPREAIKYLKLAFSYMELSSPALIAVGGYSGSGKSTIALQLALKNNAILLDSDVERKTQLNVSETQHLPDSAYTKKSAQHNYQRLKDKSMYALSAGYTVVVDATFISDKQRISIEQAAINSSIPFFGIWLDAPTEILETRIRTRRSNASDATVSVLRKQFEHSAGKIEWHIIDASDSVESTIGHIDKLMRASEIASSPVAS